MSDSNQMSQEKADGAASLSQANFVMVSKLVALLQRAQAGELRASIEDTERHEEEGKNFSMCFYFTPPRPEPIDPRPNRNWGL